MSYFPDLGRVAPLAQGEHVRAVGWLHPDHPFPQGEVPEEFVARLKEFVAQSVASTSALFAGRYMGFHICEFCGKARGLWNFGVLGDDVLFVAPEMVLHYVQEHNYCPPVEFIDSVLRSPLPETEDYQLLTEPYWHLHRIAFERALRGR